MSRAFPLYEADGLTRVGVVHQSGSPAMTLSLYGRTFVYHDGFGWFEHYRAKDLSKGQGYVVTRLWT